MLRPHGAGAPAGRHDPRGRARLGGRPARRPDGAARGPTDAQSAPAHRPARGAGLRRSPASDGRGPSRSTAGISGGPCATWRWSPPRARCPTSSSPSSALVAPRPRQRGRRARRSSREPLAGMLQLRLHVQSRPGDLQPDPAAAARRRALPPVLLSPPARGRSWRGCEQYGPLILLLLVFSGATRYIVGPLFGLVNALLPRGRCARSSSRRPRPGRSETDEGPGSRDPGPSWKNPGGDLLSRAATSTVPSALEGLTSVFGMGTGVAPPVRPPGIGKPHTRSSSAVTSNQDWKEANPRSSRTAD